jgi:hypothetical protein
VKYRRRDNPVSAAALISEVVSHRILQALQVRTFEAARVRVSAAMARHYARDATIGYQIPAGDHFGTVYRPDVVFADPGRGAAFSWEILADPTELIGIWLADSWLMNLDRAVYGNLVLEPGPPGQWHLIAADQSDCFLGASALADGSYFQRSRQHGPAAYLPLLERAFSEGGVQTLREIVERVEQTAATVIGEAVARVPDTWWREARITSGAVVQCLQERAQRIRNIVQIEHWEGLSGAIRGGFLFGR